MSKLDLLQLFRPAHKVPKTVWSSEHPLNFKPKLSTLLALVSGLWIFGTGEAILIGAGIGVSPWTVLAQGITEQTQFTVGLSTFIVGVLVLFLWVPLREIPGIGTVSNIILISLSIDVMGPYIPANLGPGPRDGWMTGIQKKTGFAIGKVRAGIELSVLCLGVFLGGTFG